MTGGSSDPREVIVASVRQTAAQRLARAFLPLALLDALALAGLVAGAFPGVVVLGVVVGSPFVAAAFLLMGQGAVRLAAGLRASGIWASAGWIWILPWGWALWVLVAGSILPGRTALQTGAWLRLGFALACGLLAVRVLRDGLRIGELRRLAETMAIPAPEEL